MYILGIDDGHDAGACIVENGKILVAINEERVSRKKLYQGFPEKSIKNCLDFLAIKPTDIKEIAISSSYLSRIIERAVPQLATNIYFYRRKLYSKPYFEKLRRLALYTIGTGGTSKAFKIFTKFQIKKKLKKLGFKNFRLHVVEHHAAHAAGAIFTSGFKKSLCITLDGTGDGLSGTINIFENDEINRISSIPTKHSLGIFYEQATALLGMRDLEDTGKLMCLSSYYYPLQKNEMSEFFKVNGLKVISKYGNIERYFKMEDILWRCEREKFAYMVQKTLEDCLLQLFKNAIEESGIKRVCWSGGVASNIKANRIIRLYSGLKEWFVFPHMGDGGLAVGAALYTDWMLNGIKPKKLQHVYLGNEYSEEEIENTLKKYRRKISYEYVNDVVKVAADLIMKNNFFGWFQGRMEYGPRALGHRSIFAPAWSLETKNELNIKVKRRAWYQPFAPSLLIEEAKKFFEDYNNQPDRFMTMGFMTKPEVRERIKAVIHIDGSSRPQMVNKEDCLLESLLKEIKKKSGDGILLNTSFNIHGEPIVCDPADAVETMIKTKMKFMIIGNFFVKLKD
jgi:carbamoyltransferase